MFYILIGLIYILWLLVVDLIMRGRKNHIDPYAGKVMNQAAFNLGRFAAYLIAGIIWPLTIMWRVVEYEMMDQKILFYEKAYHDLLIEIEKTMGVEDRDA